MQLLKARRGSNRSSKSSLLVDHSNELDAYINEWVAVNGERGVIAHSTDCADLHEKIRELGMMENCHLYFIQPKREEKCRASPLSQILSS